MRKHKNLSISDSDNDAAMFKLHGIGGTLACMLKITGQYPPVEKLAGAKFWTHAKTTLAQETRMVLPENVVSSPQLAATSTT